MHVTAARSSEVDRWSLGGEGSDVAEDGPCADGSFRDPTRLDSN